jgi:hypothetical protein
MGRHAISEAVLKFYKVMAVPTRILTYCHNDQVKEEEIGRALKPEGKRQLGRPRRTLEDNIKMDHREIA